MLALSVQSRSGRRRKKVRVVNGATQKLFCFSVKRGVFKLQMRMKDEEKQRRLLRRDGARKAQQSPTESRGGREGEAAPAERSWRWGGAAVQSGNCRRGRMGSPGTADAALGQKSLADLSSNERSAHGGRSGPFGQASEALRGCSRGPCAQSSVRKNSFARSCPSACCFLKSQRGCQARVVICSRGFQRRDYVPRGAAVSLKGLHALLLMEEITLLLSSQGHKIF